MKHPDLAPEIRVEALTDGRWAVVERIAASQHLRSSARLREFLFYVADCAIRNAPGETTEQQIGVHIFHRSPGYNSSEDSIVRTHARLLRQKLAAYFAEEGRQEPLVVEIPKGHYLPVFAPRHEAAPAAILFQPPASAPAGLAVAADGVVPSRRFPPRWLGLLTIALVTVFVSVLGWRLVRQKNAHTPMNQFWQPFFAADPPLVIFSNALFSGDSKTGLRYAQTDERENSWDENRVMHSDYVDTYTGIGELAAVYMLTTMFDEHKAHFILKRSLLMTWDEARTRNLIFLGSVAENPSLRVLQSTTDFSLVAQPGFSGVVNHHARLGEPAIYSRPERPLTRDYAILALLPGVQPGKRMLIFSGLTTFGTQAAADYVCRPDSVAELMHKISGPNGDIHPFEAVLETTIGGGVPLQTRLVTIRIH